MVDLRDPNVPLLIRHTDGSVCHSKKSYAFYNKEPPARPDELPDLPETVDTSNLNGAVNTENSDPTSPDRSQKTRNSELRDLLGLTTTDSANQDVNTENPPNPNPATATPLSGTDTPTTEGADPQGMNFQIEANRETTSINTDLEASESESTHSNQVVDKTASTNTNKNIVDAPMNDDMKDLHEAGLIHPLKNPWRRCIMSG